MPASVTASAYAAHPEKELQNSQRIVIMADIDMWSSKLAELYRNQESEPSQDNL
jgi:hypothetical protein